MSRDSIPHRAAQLTCSPTQRQSINTSTLATIISNTSDKLHQDGRLPSRFTATSDHSSQKILNVSIPNLVSQILSFTRLNNIADKRAAAPTHQSLCGQHLKTFSADHSNWASQGEVLVR